MALRYADPVPALRDYFRQRMSDAGKDAVVADLTRARDAVPEGSAAHDGFSGWLEAVEGGEDPFGA